MTDYSSKVIFYKRYKSENFRLSANEPNRWEYFKYIAENSPREWTLLWNFAPWLPTTPKTALKSIVDAALEKAELEWHEVAADMASFFDKKNYMFFLHIARPLFDYFNRTTKTLFAFADQASGDAALKLFTYMHESIAPLRRSSMSEIMTILESHEPPPVEEGMQVDEPIEEQTPTSTLMPPTAQQPPLTFDISSFSLSNLPEHCE